ncbi:MAG: MBL fold metallo-hydrolase, partial [Deltaproteobacteria bacterium]|nr:MBL fold metallo-hydrolase [Deltaproteobacteria bacterium]
MNVLTPAGGSNNTPATAMKLHILGCGDAFGSGGRQQSSYLVEADDRLFLLDCGPTALLALKRAGFDPGRLDAILLSHLHGDHFGGLPFFLIDFIYREARKGPLAVAGPPGTESRVRQLFELMYSGANSENAHLPLSFHLLSPDQPARVA